MQIFLSVSCFLPFGGQENPKTRPIGKILRLDAPSFQFCIQKNKGGRQALTDLPAPLLRVLLSGFFISAFRTNPFFVQSNAAQRAALDFVLRFEFGRSRIHAACKRNFCYIQFVF